MLVAVVCIKSKQKVVNDSVMYEGITTTRVCTNALHGYYRCLEDEVSEVL